MFLCSLSSQQTDLFIVQQSLAYACGSLSVRVVYLKWRLRPRLLLCGSSGSRALSAVPLTMNPSVLYTHRLSRKV